MLNYVYHWRKELYDCYLSIAKSMHCNELFLQDSIEIEKALMIGAYIIRKLNEAEKIPINLLATKVELKKATYKNTVIDILNEHKLDQHYDFTFDSTISCDWIFILNQFIHSHVCMMSVGDNDLLNGFLINSDKSKVSGLFFLPIELIFTIFLTVSEGNLTSMYYERNPLDGKMVSVHLSYSYPDNFDIIKAVSNTVKGNIYQREIQ